MNITICIIRKIHPTLTGQILPTNKHLQQDAPLNLVMLDRLDDIALSEGGYIC